MAVPEELLEGVPNVKPFEDGFAAVEAGAGEAAPKVKVAAGAGEPKENAGVDCWVD